MNDSNRDNTVARGGGINNDAGCLLSSDADMAMFSKITRNNGEKRGGGRGRGSVVDCTIGVDGETYDLSNLSTELTTKATLDAAKDPSKVLEKKRSERRMMKLYPTKGSVRLKAPSIRNIDSCFTGSQESSPEEIQTNDRLSEQGRQQGQCYGGSSQYDDYYNNSNNSDNPTGRYHGTGGGGPAAAATANQNQDHFRKQAPVNVQNLYDDTNNMPSGQQHHYGDGRSMNNSRYHQQQLQTSTNHQNHRNDNDTSTTTLSPEEEARRMMEERFKKKDDPVSQLYTQISRKPDARPASLAVSPSAPANYPAAPGGTTRRNNDNPAIKSRRESLIRNYSSKFNLKPSAQPSYETFEIEVSPGVHLPMRGAEETEQAMKEGRIREMQCFCCETRLCCIITAEFVYCPICSVIGPIEYPSSDAHGVGLGLTQEAVDEIVKGNGTWIPPSIISNN